MVSLYQALTLNPPLGIHKVSPGKTFTFTIPFTLTFTLSEGFDSGLTCRRFDQILGIFGCGSAFAYVPG
jgi:hypothetical protein